MKYLTVEIGRRKATQVVVFLLLFLCIAPTTSLAQADGDIAALYRQIKRRGSDYVVTDSALVRVHPDSARIVKVLPKHTPLHRLRQMGTWTRIRTADGVVGFVDSKSLSDLWIYVSKTKRMVYVYRGLTLIDEMNADFPNQIRGDKLRRGSRRRPEDWRTPEGLFFISKKNARSRFYKALILNYPTPSHAARALSAGIIGRRQYNRISKAGLVFRSPPMNTPMGGLIEIHGHGILGRADWTKGCVAVENEFIDKLWEWVEVGTPVWISSVQPRQTRWPLRKLLPQAPDAPIPQTEQFSLRQPD